MVEKKADKVEKAAAPAAKTKKPDAATKNAGKKPATKKSKSLSYGKVLFKASLSHGKWRFVNKAESDKLRKKKLAKLAKLKASGVEIKEKVKKKQRPSIVVKPIKGASNGETRKVHRRRKNFYPSQKKPVAHRPRGFFSHHKRSVRPSLTPGTILILLAGVNKGKRVVLLKNLDSGLLLVTGPFLLNGVPLRRVQQCHVIGTKTKLDLSKVKLSEKLVDKTFKRVVERRSVKKGDKTIFVPKKKSYRPSAERKELQKDVDKQILDVIKAHHDKKPLLAYLSAMFGLRNNQYPHRLQF